MPAIVNIVNTDSSTNGDCGGVPLVNFAAGYVSETGTTITVGASHYGRHILHSNASASTCTLPASAPLGTQIELSQEGAGAVTFAAGTNATVHAAGGNLKTNGQYSGAIAKVVGNSDGAHADWRVYGNLTS